MKKQSVNTFKWIIDIYWPRNLPAKLKFMVIVLLHISIGFVTQERGAEEDFVLKNHEWSKLRQFFVPFYCAKSAAKIQQYGHYFREISFKGHFLFLCLRNSAPCLICSVWKPPSVYSYCSLQRKNDTAFLIKVAFDIYLIKMMHCSWSEYKCQLHAWGNILIQHHDSLMVLFTQNGT